MLGKIQRLFKAVPQENLSAEIPFNGRLVTKIKFYLDNDLALVCSEAGRARAIAYREAIFSDDCMKAAPGIRPEDYYLVIKVFNDVMSGFGEGPLGSSSVLRRHLMDALCEHLGVGKQQMHDAMIKASNDLIVASAGAMSHWQLENAGLRKAHGYLMEGLYRKHYATRPRVQVTPEENAIEMRSYKKNN